jgi:crotonobetainyl-CoA:carnitine CoA-transferase CaiB-like acyl-CoA transferase
MLLADLGAEVIKIETPGVGDYMRMIPPFVQDTRTGEEVGAAYLAINRNKKSVGLNYRNKRGKEILLRLARDADVVIETFRAGAAERWGFGYETMRALNPRLVYCSLSGYGQSGPYKERAGHDLNYIALAGLLAVNGTAEGPPIPPMVQVADLSGGMLAAISILAAIVGRTKTGVGQYLDVSLFDGALSWAGTIIGGAFLSNTPIERGKMQLNGGMACYNVYETSDGKFITLGAIEPHFWASFCKAVGREDLIPLHQAAEGIPAVAAIFKARTLAEWLAFAQTVEACIEPVRDFAQVFDDPHVQHRGLIQESNGMPQIGSVFTFAENPNLPPPMQGEHTREILFAAGLSDAEIAELNEAGVIKLP